jgi:peroxiredoxin
MPGTALLGKPVEVQFKAVDGRQVDLATQRGKVVLLDFWATWCPPCIKEVPQIKAAYEKWHDRGFEVIGISLDDKKEDLLSFLNRNKIEWPQYFDGSENRIAKRFGIEEIPTMWLIDKQGKLRDVDAVGNLSERVEKLLSENSP